MLLRVQEPYGAVLVKEDQIILRGHNTAQRDNDVAAHAEVNVLRQFTFKNGSYSLDHSKVDFIFIFLRIHS